VRAIRVAVPCSGPFAPRSLDMRERRLDGGRVLLRRSDLPRPDRARRSPAPRAAAAARAPDLGVLGPRDRAHCHPRTPVASEPSGRRDRFRGAPGCSHRRRRGRGRLSDAVVSGIQSVSLRWIFHFDVVLAVLSALLRGRVHGVLGRRGRVPCVHQLRSVPRARARGFPRDGPAHRGAAERAEDAASSALPLQYLEFHLGVARAPASRGRRCARRRAT
jgi:hypothetical protein